MKKYIWLCNTIPKTAAKRYGLNDVLGVSWIDSTLPFFYKDKDTLLYILFPTNDGKLTEIKDGNFIYYPFQNQKKNPYEYNAVLENKFYDLLTDIQPDIIHVFGTEYAHALAMMHAVKKASLQLNTLINIQGLCTFISRHYYAFLSPSVIHSYTIRDFLRHDNIFQQRKKFEARGRHEGEALKIAHHIAGRTEWDKACIREINPHAQYYKCDEILRPAFYDKQWNSYECQKYSIFISQAYYPLKGFHILLEAASSLITKYPELQIYTTGISPFDKNWIRLDSYSKYIKTLIRKYELRNHVHYLGQLDEEEICQQYLKANVFVSASSIENSSNSLSEAMMLGVPCVASDVGGTNSLFTHNVDGYLYQADAPYMLSYYIDNIFSDIEKANYFSHNARQHAREAHDKTKICQQLKGIYETIFNQSE